MELWSIMDDKPTKLRVYILKAEGKPIQVMSQSEIDYMVKKRK